MATTDQNVPLWPHIEVSWTTPTSDELWQKLAVGQESVVRLVESADVNVANQVVPHSESDAQEEGQAVPISIRSVYILSQNRTIEPRYTELNVARPVDGSVLQWQLMVKKMPDTPPPELIINSSKGIGGFEGGMELMRAVIGLSAPMAYFSATYQYAAMGAICRVLDSSPRMLLDLSGVQGSMRQVSYRIEDGWNGLRNVSIDYDKEGDRYVVNLSLRMLLSVDESVWFPLVNEICAETKASLFYSSEDADGIR